MFPLDDWSFYLLILGLSLVNSVICGWITLPMNADKGYKNGFWWGFFFEEIGIIVVALRPHRKEGETISSMPDNQAEQLREFKKLLDDGVISNEEYDAKKKQILNL